MCCFRTCYQQPVAKGLQEKAPKKPAPKATEKKGKTVEHISNPISIFKKKKKGFIVSSSISCQLHFIVQNNKV
ncbi:mediator of RNA polymerase II transcription subunit 18 isoform X2 [Gossypium australe]|uniref:Mediator of RNA polymerase II transcription subunit 18 isoform X2 n=1 Tax=Gossypium australe TaxID=47621 RepID=A0A5B6VY13_9ROSI|nr:mediator of RNA polymerase II transcription subunit 18 isoform X2 [Gossypium australe]